MQLFKFPVERFKGRPIFQGWGSRPASVETKGIVVRLGLGRGQTDRGQLRYFGFTQIFLEVESGDIIYNVLTVVDTPGNVVVRVDRDGLDLKNNVELLAWSPGELLPFIMGDGYVGATELVENSSLNCVFR